MSMIISTIKKEKKRIDYMIAAYSEQLENLPRGSVAIKNVGQNTYYYLKYRIGKRVYTDYLGKDGEKIEAIRADLEKRRHIESMIANLRSELSLANKVLEGNA